MSGGESEAVVKRYGASALLVGVVAMIGVGSALARGIDCTGGPCSGTPGNDVIAGSPNDDQIRGLAGDDVINGGDGDDTEIGGPGRDRLSDYPFGKGDPLTANAEVLKGGGERDYAEGSLGPDKILGGKAGDRSFGVPGRARQRRGFGEISCLGDFCSALFGDPGNDLMKGGGGRDYMEGEQGTDTYFGGAGGDVIDATNEDTPGAKDRISCGAGRDVVFANPKDRVAEDCERVKPPQPNDQIREGR